jgi:hypothetical protein
MSEELLAVQGEQAPVVEQQVETKVDPYEDQAREQGWRPKEEFEGDPEKWKPAKEFVDRGELFQKIDGLGKELKETRKALKMLQEHHTKVKETEYKRAVDELKALQKRHLEEGNSDGYLEASELLTDLKAEQKAREAVAQVQPAQQDTRFTSWVSANAWYEKDPELREYADVVGMGYANKNPGLDPEEVLKYVTVQVKSRFKEKFQNPNRTRPSAVEGNTAPAASNKSSFELTDDERRVMNTFVRAGVMTKEEYVAQVKTMRGAR